MPIKDILVGLSARTEQNRAVDFALSMAMQFDAEVTGIIYALEPSIPFSVYPEFTADLMNRHRSEASQATELARGKFVTAARQAGVRHEFHTERSTVAEAHSDFARRLRTADLAILVQH